MWPLLCSHEIFPLAPIEHFHMLWKRYFRNNTYTDTDPGPRLVQSMYGPIGKLAWWHSLPTHREARKSLSFVSQMASSGMGMRERGRREGGGGRGVGFRETSSKTNWLEGPHWITKKHIPRRPCCSLELNRRSGATVPNREGELVRSSSFAKKNNEQVSDGYHASKYWLFATFARIFLKSPCHGQFPAVACRRLLRGADCSAKTDDRSLPQVTDPASISTISEPRKTTQRC